MAKWNKGLVAAMEELEEMENEGTEVEGGADSLETSMIEANEAGADLDDMDSSIEEAVEGAEEIEAIADTLGETIEEGGADAATARVAEVAVESIFRRLNIKRKAMPSMESFGTRSSRVQATKIAVEGMKESAKMVWEKIKKAVKAAWEWVKGFFDKLFDAATKLKIRAEAFVKKSAEIKGSAKEKEMAAGGFVGALQLGGKFDEKTPVLAAEYMQALLIENGQGVDALIKVIKQANQEVASNKATEKASEEPLDQIKKNTESLPGNKMIEFVEGKYFSKKGFQIVDGKEAKFSGEKVPVASTETIKKIATEVKVLADQVLQNKKLQEKLSQHFSIAEKMLTAAEKVSDEAKIEGMKSIVPALVEANSMSIAFSKNINSYSITVGKAALDYAEKSMGQYGA